MHAAVAAVAVAQQWWWSSGGGQTVSKTMAKANHERTQR
jgi:hypothetical protein